MTTAVTKITEGIPDAVLCPDRAGTAMAVSFCEAHCEKYLDGECVHFPLENHEKPANNGTTIHFAGDGPDKV